MRLTLKSINYLFLILIVIILLTLTYIRVYNIGLSGDIHVFYNRASFFIQHLSLSELKDNEYQPGALLFFIILSPVLKIDNSYELFRNVFFGANIILVFLLAYIYSKYSKSENIFIFSLILLFTGPIIFYRFELLVGTLVCFAFLLWKNKQDNIASFILGIGTQVKIYPVIFLPYLLILAYKNKGLVGILKNLFSYFAGLFSFLFGFMLIFKPNLVDLYNSLNYHALKSVGTETIWAFIIQFYDLTKTGIAPVIEYRYGILALMPQDIIAPLWFYNYVWLLPFTIIHFWFLKISKDKALSFDIRFCLLNVLLLLIFSKVIAPQYLLWLTLLIPFIDVKTILYNKGWLFNYFTILIVCLLYQILYPLNYSTWLNDFQSGNTLSILSFVNLYRNFFLVILAIRIFFELRKESIVKGV